MTPPRQKQIPILLQLLGFFCPCPPFPHATAKPEKLKVLAQAGLADGPGFRTDFPLYPATNDDFTTLLAPSRIPSLDMSHACFNMPTFPSDASSGRNATLQLRYTAEYIDPNHSHRLRRHTAENQTFYACADVTLVDPAVFTFEIPCFNVTADAHGGSSTEGDDGHSHSHDEADDAGTAAGESSEDGTQAQGSSKSSSSSGLSKEAIAGVVIGCVVGVGMLVSLGFYLYRRDRREKQIAQDIATAVEK
ncbi:unnamed protein product [Parascedosporium putredinis]|uniref:Copper acquisition factor BIM1-like domain-containing protein n=1 Tax=Parascedosporium putredinis TaxID=1442378 RepID=A0A9P1HCQ9_9PEZI|nr:unnamed protein product [Parascedosporium putredinis]CAI8004944.1 unnamed protein product [Parascedosporium putredinis]